MKSRQSLITVVTALVVLLCVEPNECRIEHMVLPAGLTDCFTRHQEKTSIVDTVGESIASFCFGQYMWHAARERGIQGFNISREVRVIPSYICFISRILLYKT